MRLADRLLLCGIFLLGTCNPQPTSPPPPEPISYPPEQCYQQRSCNFSGDPSTVVFVATSGLDSNPGTQTAPLKTIAAGLARAQVRGSSQVYVSVGIYAETVTLVNGVSMYGGYDASQGWTYTLNALTEIDGTLPVPGPSSVAIAVDGNNITSLTHIMGFKMISADNLNPGGSSYALRCQTCTSLDVQFDVLIAGKAEGALSGSPGMPGIPGAIGQSGGVDASCNGTPGLGGAGGTSTLGRQGGKGGDGGAAMASSALAGNDGFLGQVGTFGGMGGAVSGYGAPGNAGTSGINGSNGPGGGGATWLAGQIVVAAGTSGGTDATPGNGGGGGGGGGGTPGLFSRAGGGGGSGGGSGGGAGNPGSGGGGGGASVAIVLSDSTGVVVANCTLQSGSAGDGGAGGSGGSGGTGGMGGFVFPGSCGFGGGLGGRGGDGGAGGAGGGGAGGLSCGVYQANTTLTLPPSVQVTLGPPGQGGLGGQRGNNAMDRAPSGAAGVAASQCIAPSLS